MSLTPSQPRYFYTYVLDSGSETGSKPPLAKCIQRLGAKYYHTISEEDEKIEQREEDQTLL